MSNGTKYLFRILTGIILFLTNNDFTWKIVNHFANINGDLSVNIVSTFRKVLVIVSLIGLIIALLNAALLFFLTFNKEKKG
ncbi:MAG: hypothetical protein K0R54_2541 [Clostridiaceae bacterium]|jgi:hypothetical protein|uniref:hypothetical protein n=1 Tax=Clostridium sp. TaxID=1506 RepID=UPI00258AC4C6|nr:hypothetical protein [Clostridium sp.]MDF2505577.1 hypothetical protein [Clostridium sp.]MDF2881984.1 hypothetical protein [Clostridiaceae bacterium]